MLNIRNIDPDRLYSTGELAIIMDCSIKTARKKLKEIEHIYDGVYKIPGYAILEYLRKHTHSPSERIDH